MAEGRADRLPWLTEPPRPQQPKSPARPLAWLWIGVAAAVAALAAAAYWIGTRQPTDAAADNAQANDGYVISSPIVPELPPATPETNLTSEIAEAPPEPKARPRKSAPSRVAATPRAPEIPLTEGLTPVFTELPEGASEPAPLPPPIRRTARVGRIIQIGAYPNAAQADAAWRTVVRRWPYLASKPRIIAPLDVRSSDGRATRMHRLQLATASQAQSVVICQQLEAARVSCVVVY